MPTYSFLDFWRAQRDVQAETVGWFRFSRAYLRGTTGMLACLRGLGVQSTRRVGVAAGAGGRGGGVSRAASDD
jgi:hypothetical protein